VSPDRYLYPPATAILLVPFAFSEHFALHQWIWHGLLASLVFWLSGLGAAELAAMALLSRYLVITFMYGQINLPVLALLAMAGRQLGNSRAGVAGGLWALAAGLKVYPAVLAPAFLRRDRWWAWIGAGGAACFLLALPFLVFGSGLGAQLYGDFFSALQEKGLPLHSHNQSLTALLLRLCTPERFMLQAVGPESWGLVNWPPGFVRALALGIGAAVAGASWWAAWKRGFGVAGCLSATAFSILFLSHIVWKDYLLFLYFPLAELFVRWPWRRSLILAGAFLAVVTFSSPDVLGAPLATRCEAACIHLWAAGLIWVAWWKK
jgi:hypothetical protein